jgi:hypothetical protein
VYVSVWRGDSAIAEEKEEEEVVASMAIFRDVKKGFSDTQAAAYTQSPLYVMKFLMNFKTCPTFGRTLG